MYGSNYTFAIVFSICIGNALRAVANPSSITVLSRFQNHIILMKILSNLITIITFSVKYIDFIFAT